MTTNMDYFIAVAEEKSISKAAERMYISQQSMSNYIKRLEERYRVKLFNRKPQLTLTDAGQKLLDAFLQIKKIESTVTMELDETNTDRSGNITLGITGGRARLILPKLLPSFSRIYPNVRISIVQKLTNEFERDLVNGKLDLFIGTAPLVSAHIRFETLMYERFYLVISNELLRTHFSERYPQCVEDFKEGVDIGAFQHVPFAFATAHGRLRQITDTFLNAQNIIMQPVFECSGTDLSIELCRQNYCACFCAEMFANEVMLEQHQSAANRLHVFGINNFHDRRQLVIAWARDLILPSYTAAMIEMVGKIVKSPGSPL